MAERQQQFDGLDIMSGDVNLKNGNLSVSGTSALTGAVTLTGAATVSGTAALLGAVLQAGISSSTAQGGATTGITFTTASVINRKLPTGACGTAILAPGTVNGQIIVVSNLAQNTGYTITFDAPATSNVWDDGTNPQVIKAGTAKMFYWDSNINTTGAWVAFAPYAG